MKESGAHAVKLEGGAEIKESVKRILAAGIPVMGHLGLTPQSIYKFGTYTVRAKEEEEVLAFKDRVNDNTDAGAETSSQSTTISDSDDDNVPLADIVRRRKAAIADKPKKRKSASTHTEPRKKTKVTSRKQTK